MAHNTYMTYLMKGITSGSSTTWEKLCDIKDFPDLGGAPNALDTTTLSDPAHTYIQDILDNGGNLEFNANYDLATYITLEGYKGVEGQYAVWFGGTASGNTVTPSGNLGKYEFDGYLTVWKKGAGVGAVQEMGIAISPSTPIVQTATVSG